MVENEDRIRRSHPVFSVRACRLLSAECVNLPSNSKKTILVIASPGIAFLQDRFWIPKFATIAIIPYLQIKGIRVDSNSVAIDYGDKDSIRFTHESHLRLAAQIDASRCALFAPSAVPYYREIDESVAAEFGTLLCPCEDSSNLVDRFLSHAMLPTATVTSDRLTVAINCLSGIRTSVTLDSTFSRLPPSLQNEVAAAFEHDTRITELIFQGLSFHEAVKYAIPLFSTPNVVSRICFIGITFQSDYQEFTRTISRENFKKCRQLRWSCQFLTAHFLGFRTMSWMACGGSAGCRRKRIRWLTYSRRSTGHSAWRVCLRDMMIVFFCKKYYRKSVTRLDDPFRSVLQPPGESSPDKVV
jgi:hypothetical protein